MSVFSHVTIGTNDLAKARGFYDAALALAHGGRCEGPPGLRPLVPNFYAAYVRDPAGNKLVASCTKAP